MGSGPTLTPENIAYTFARLYYDIVAKIPEKLSGLYNADSVLSHGSEAARGADEIAAVCLALPLAHQKATLLGLTVQNKGSDYVVAVQGALPDARLFSQTFILARPDGSHAAHLYLRHDIFCLLPKDVPAAAAAFEKAANAHVKEDRPAAAAAPAAPVAAESDAATTGSPPPVYANGAPKSSSPASVVVSTPKKVITPESSPVSESPIAKQPVVDVVDDVVVVPEPVQEPTSPVTTETAPPPNTTPQKAASPAKKEPVKPTAARPAQKPRSVPVPPPKPAAERAPEKPAGPPPPKTWASIVSTNKLAAPAAAAPAAAATPSPVAPSQAAESEPAPPAEVAAPPAAGAGPGGKHQGAKQGKPGAKPAHGAKAANNLGMVPAKASLSIPPAGGTAPAGGARHSVNHAGATHLQQNGGPGHYGAHNGPYQPRGDGGYKTRTFGPSAIVDLKPVLDMKLPVREIVHLFKDEFGKYGRVRNVDVKIPRGIAFIEYDTPDAVRAAVDAWAAGPRPDGRLAGVALDVSEKRPPAHRRPGSTRGGGGGPRGGGGGSFRASRRVRPASSPAS